MKKQIKPPPTAVPATIRELGRDQLERTTGGSGTNPLYSAHSAGTNPLHKA